jgi:hypothetical protein
MQFRRNVSPLDEPFSKAKCEGIDPEYSAPDLQPLQVILKALRMARPGRERTPCRAGTNCSSYSPTRTGWERSGKPPSAERSLRILRNLRSNEIIESHLQLVVNIIKR